MMPSAGRWPIVFFASTVVFLGLALAVSLSGVPAMERTVYDAIQEATASPMILAAFRRVTRLGSESLLFPAGIVILAALPGRLLRHWWLWVAAALIASSLEGIAKNVVGRPRPIALSLGFPSGHTASAAAFLSWWPTLPGQR